MTIYSQTDYLILHANCLPVKGAIRSTICDIQRGKYYYVPNDLADILSSRKVHLHTVYKEYGDENHDVLNQYFDYIISNELGFIDDDPDVFPSLNMEWQTPSKITNAIVDLEQNMFDQSTYSTAFEELSSFNCHSIQLRFFNGVELKWLEKLLTSFQETRFKDIKLVLKNLFTAEELKNLIEGFGRISEIILFASEQTKLIEISGVSVIYIKDQDIDASNCGNICRGGFSVNIEHYTESQEYNSCLNRKISIDQSGNIKNCPSQSFSYGNNSNTSLTEVLRNKNFKSLWSIKKDDIKICQDCEYRYICTDCRVFLEDANDQYSKPLKCSYDPYTATWQ
ncbi:MAG: grasp-with-spasm system SPASM domain peptide maturase [Cyclobacteriaceae bacterium]